MTFVARSASEIRDVALANWRARYLARGEDLSIEPGSDSFNQIDALSLEFEGLEIAAQEAAHRVLLRYAASTDLDEFAQDDGTARVGASKARRTVVIAGPAVTSSPIGGATLSSSDGLRFVPIDAATGAPLAATPMTDGSGNATMTVEAVVAGSPPNALAGGSLLTWTSAPTSFAATAVLGGTTVAGEDAESDDQLRERLLLRRRERPGGGNRSWWHEAVIVVAGVGEVFVYRVMASPAATPDITEGEGSLGVYSYTPNTRGTITVIPLAPAPTSYAEGADGATALFSRAPSLALVQRVRLYLAGDRDANGNAPGSGYELYPAHMTPENFYVAPPRKYERDVVVSVAAASGWRWLPGNNAVDVSGTSTTTVLELDLPLTDWAIGDRIAIADWGTGATRIRGGWFLRRIVSINAGSRSVTLDTALPGVPPAGTPTRPDAVNTTTAASLWATMREKTCIMFDGLGPGPGPAQTFRFPDVVRDGYPSDLTRASLLRVALNVAGVADASITTPAASEVAPVGGYFVLRDFRVERMV